MSAGRTACLPGFATTRWSVVLTAADRDSPNSMPPEQAAARRGLVGKRSDVSSLGAILYPRLTGGAPFVAPTVAETSKQVQEAEPVSPTVLNPHPCIPKLLERRLPSRHTILDLASPLR